MFKKGGIDMSFEMPTAQKAKERTISSMKQVVVDYREKMTPEHLSLYSSKLNEIREGIAKEIRHAADDCEREITQFYEAPDTLKENELIFMLHNVEVELLALGYEVAIRQSSVNLHVHISW